MVGLQANLSLSAIRSEQPIQFSHQIHTILNQDNYLLWKSQVFPVLRGHDLVSFIDGSCIKPSHTITIDEVTTINPAFAK
jgi:gag-polypeptide of LTR copia-type